jgi:sugar lactone lactonase YvrE
VTVAVHDGRVCGLGEGALWRPGAEELVWFDIDRGAMLARGAGGAWEWRVGGRASAAARVDGDRLLIADETGLHLFDLRDGARRAVCAVEADDPSTRSNDGRADPFGGFWIGTMGKRAEPGRGAIRRRFRGETRRLWAGLTIPNAICFAPDGRRAFFADTPTRRILSVALDAEGWPAAEPETFADLSAEGLNPDGAVTDADGALWVALWGAGAVAAFAPDGSRLRTVAFPAPHVSCPAFGGPDLTTLFCTSATQGMDAAARAAHPAAGMTFAAAGAGRGRAEPAVAHL